MSRNKVVDKSHRVRNIKDIRVEALIKEETKVAKVKVALTTGQVMYSKDLGPVIVLRGTEGTYQGQGAYGIYLVEATDGSTLAVRADELTVHPFVVGDLLVHSSFAGNVAKLVGNNPDGSFSLQFDGSKDVRRFADSLLLRKATDEEVIKYQVAAFISGYEHGELFSVYLEWLREAGTEGVANDCGHTKDAHWNYTCSCRTMVKLYHRFSVFKDIAVNKLKFNIIDVEQENGKHKTVLVAEPSALFTPIHSLSKEVN